MNASYIAIYLKPYARYKKASNDTIKTIKVHLLTILPHEAKICPSPN